MSDFRPSPTSSIFVAGHRGMVGSAILRLLAQAQVPNLLTAPRSGLDLTVQADVDLFFADHRPECVILAAAKVGGIRANQRDPAGFLYENLQIQNNVIRAAHRHGVKRFVFLGSSCIYPRECPQPMREDHLLTGPLEPTNEGYALAKIVGLKLTQYLHRNHGFNSLNLMPCNLYGPNDSFDLEHSHVLSALVRRFSEAVRSKAESLTLWGSGRARREFMHVDDLARAVHHFLFGAEPHIDLMNVGWGEDLSIADLASIIARQTGYAGEVVWDTSKPDGMMRKCMDVSQMRARGFSPRISLETGIRQMIQLYREKFPL